MRSDESDGNTVPATEVSRQGPVWGAGQAETRAPGYRPVFLRDRWGDIDYTFVGVGPTNKDGAAMQLDTNGHASDECLEQYAQGSLEEPLLGEIEEHLLLCSQCQEHLNEIDAYRAAMRSAAARLEGEEESRKRFWTRVSAGLTVRRLGWIFALGAVAV